jgi:hypothetical protein
MNNKMTVVIISLSMLMSLAVSAAGRPSLSAHEQRITTLEGQTSTLATDLADIALTPGPKGDVGEAGTKGAEGVKGDVGEAGTQGTPGIKGDDGAAGNRGEDGSDGLNGIDAIAGTANGQMQYWDGDTWQIISAPDMMMSEAQVLTPHDGGFRWVTADSISPGDENCPAFTYYSLQNTMDATFAYATGSFTSNIGPYGLIFSGMGSRAHEWIEYSIQIHMNNLSINSNIAQSGTYFIYTTDDHPSIDGILISEAQLQKCQEILSHASIHFIAPSR